MSDQTTAGKTRVAQNQGQPEERRLYRRIRRIKRRYRWVFTVDGEQMEAPDQAEPTLPLELAHEPSPCTLYRITPNHNAPDDVELLFTITPAGASGNHENAISAEAGTAADAATVESPQVREDAKYLTTREAAVYLRYKGTSGVRELVRRGALKPAGRRGKTYLFLVDDLDIFATGKTQRLSVSLVMESDHESREEAKAGAEAKEHESREGDALPRHHPTQRVLLGAGARSLPSHRKGGGPTTTTT